MPADSAGSSPCRNWKSRSRKYFHDCDEQFWRARWWAATEDELLEALSEKPATGKDRMPPPRRPHPSRPGARLRPAPHRPGLLRGDGCVRRGGSRQLDAPQARPGHRSRALARSALRRDRAARPSQRDGPVAGPPAVRRRSFTIRHLLGRWARRNPAHQYAVLRSAYARRCRAEPDDLRVRTLSQALPPTNKYPAFYGVYGRSSDRCGQAESSASGL